MTKDEQALWAKYKKTINAQRMNNRTINDLNNQMNAATAARGRHAGNLCHINQLMTELAMGNTLEVAMSDMGVNKAFVEDMRELLNNV